MIVTIGLDNMDNNFDLSLKRVNIIQRSKLFILTGYIEQLCIYLYDGAF